MRLTKKDGIYIAITTPEEGHLPKRAGFIWDGLVPGHWATKFTACAEKLREYADETCRDELVPIGEINPEIPYLEGYKDYPPAPPLSPYKRKLKEREK